ncbi:hypothetical protein [Streptomyces sp. NPDC048269]|uniref:hypothetical protein n=1 Tax=Streptomyces sp. NPDC048269 TaxID=3155753 RepID=UPI003423E76F
MPEWSATRWCPAEDTIGGAEWTDDEAFAAYGLDETTIATLRTRAVEWADDLAARLLEESDDPDID